MVARALVGVQAEVVQRYGFEGDAGYAQAQVCLMDHATDAVVTASIAAATNNVYACAGINLQEVSRALPYTAITPATTHTHLPQLIGRYLRTVLQPTPTAGDTSINGCLKLIDGHAWIASI
jgi:hypothetical protein